MAVILTWRRLGNLGPAFRLLAQGQERREVFFLCGLVERGQVAQERAATDRVVKHHLGLLEQAGLFLVTESPPTVAPQDQESGEQIAAGPVFLVQPVNVIVAARPAHFGVEEHFLEQNMGTGCTIQFLGDPLRLREIMPAEGVFQLLERAGHLPVIVDECGCQGGPFHSHGARPFTIEA